MQKIVIDRFKQVSHAEIELHDYLFLIGEQASGKSTIAKLIYFFKSLKQEYLALVSSTPQPGSADLVPLLVHSIQDKFNIYFGYTTRLDDNFVVRFYFSVEDNHYVTLSKGNSLQIKFNRDFSSYLRRETTTLKRSLASLSRQAGSSSRGNAIVQQRLRDTISQRIQEAANRVFSDERECLFIPAGRNITVSYPEQFQLLFFGELQSAVTAKKESNTIDLLLIRDFVNYSKLLADYFVDRGDDSAQTAFHQRIQQNIAGILHARYRNQGGYEKLFYNDEEFTPLNIASSGQQESIRLIQDALYVLGENFQASRIIEEPETHLFPTAQKLMIQLLIMVANKTGSQLIITTHSPHVQATFNNLLYYTRVLNREPERRAAIEAHFGTEHFDESQAERLNILADKFQAYTLRPGEEVYCTSIVDEETHLIGENSIDNATEDIYDEFDFLYSLL